MIRSPGDIWVADSVLNLPGGVWFWRETVFLVDSHRVMQILLHAAFYKLKASISRLHVLHDFKGFCKL